MIVEKGGSEREMREKGNWRESEKQRVVSDRALGRDNEMKQKKS